MQGALSRHRVSAFLLLGVIIIVFFLLNLLLGSVHIPISEVLHILTGNVSQVDGSVSPEQLVIHNNIIWKSRVPQALTALVAGAGLAVSGLLMQTVFRNPLAGPSVLGISSGASLGVACVVLLSGSLGGVALSRMGYLGEMALSVAAIIGALSVMALIVFVSQKVKGNVTLLIIGVMIGYVATAIIGVLKYFSVEEDIRAYVIWGLGSFSRVAGDQMILFVIIMVLLLPLSFLLVKTLNLLLLGDGYARNLGLNIRRARFQVITCAGVLVAIVTAYCGPIMFIGLAVPHLCRAMFRTSDHRILLPSTLLTGSAVALACNLIAGMPGFEGALPVNSVTALVGAPVVASVLFGKRKEEVSE
ncbi:MAG: iron ABC transporter permease [Bacteroidaceae bacterium]|nr:iron ABC transporter permease [Bacteroidaceae bacterium]